MSKDNYEIEDLSRELQKELEKEIELNLEKEKLKEIREIIKEETLKYVSKRKELSEFIIKYREELLEEFKFDEDKVAEYFDHEKFVKEETFKFMDRKLKELTLLNYNPYFGKVDFAEEGYDENIYIGRFGLTRDGDIEPTIVDWRAPIAAIFYAGKVGEVRYNPPAGEATVYVQGKRQFIIKKGNLVGMFDSNLDVKDEILQMVLSKSAKEKLKDIVMTIQEEQDNLIRYPRNKTIVVNGVAGSGKTTVALHRVAYLLYNYRNILKDKVLIIGPNSIFIDYISEVLPSLGEVGVKQTTFRDFAMSLIGISEAGTLKESVEKILKNEVLSEEVKYKTSEEYVKDLDNLLKELEKDCFKIEDIYFYDNNIINKAEIEGLFYKHYLDMPLFRRSKKIKRIIYSKIKDEALRRVLNIEKEYKEKISKLSKDDYVLIENDLYFKRKLAIREVLQESINTKRKLKKWIENPTVIDIYNSFNSFKQITFEDLTGILYLKVKLEGKKYEREIKHIVIDEAQDYSLLQFKVIKELTGCKSFTIVGDANQSIMPYETEVPMMKVNKIFHDVDVDYFSLNTSYRSTKEIMEYANSFLEKPTSLNLIRSGEKVIEEKACNDEEIIEKTIKYIEEFSREDLESIAVICSSQSESNRFGKLLKEKIDIKIIDNEDMLYKSGKVIIPSYYAKGLEFDGVIFLENEKSKIEGRLKYIIASRALHRLVRIKLISN